MPSLTSSEAMREAMLFSRLQPSKSISADLESTNVCKVRNDSTSVPPLMRVTEAVRLHRTSWLYCVKGMLSDHTCLDVPGLNCNEATPRYCRTCMFKGYESVPRYKTFNGISDSSQTDICGKLCEAPRAYLSKALTWIPTVWTLSFIQPYMHVFFCFSFSSAAHSERHRE